MQHLCVVACVGDGVVVVEQTQLHHQLATVADAEREGVLAGIELVERLLCLRVVEECTCPTLGRAEHVGVGEATAEGDEVNLLEGLATSDEVGHGDVLHVEAGHVERVSHLALRVGTLLTDDSRYWATALRTGLCLQRSTLEGPLYWHLLIVDETLCRLAVEALATVEQV